MCRCIMGQQPRKFDATRAQLLANMAELLVRQLERTWALQLQEEQQGKQLARSMSVYDSACLFVDVSKPTWRVLHANVPAIEQLGECNAGWRAAGLLSNCMCVHADADVISYIKLFGGQGCGQQPRAVYLGECAFCSV